MAEQSEVRSSIRDVIIIMQKISDNSGDERESLKALISHSTTISNFLETAGQPEKKQMLHAGLKALLEAVKTRDASAVEAALGKLKGLMKDVVNEVKKYTQNDHPKSKRNTPQPKRSDTIHGPPLQLPNAPPLHQQIKTTPDIVNELRRSHPPITVITTPTTVDERKTEEIKKSAEPPSVELKRADSTSLDLGDGSEHAQSVTGWLRLITYLATLQAS